MLWRKKSIYQYLSYQERLELIYVKVKSVISNFINTIKNFLYNIFFTLRYPNLIKKNEDYCSYTNIKTCANDHNDNTDQIIEEEVQKKQINRYNDTSKVIYFNKDGTDKSVQEVLKKIIQVKDI